MLVLFCKPKRRAPSLTISSVKALFTRRKGEVVFSTKTISLSVFFKKAPGAKITQPQQ